MDVRTFCYIQNSWSYSTWKTNQISRNTVQLHTETITETFTETITDVSSETIIDTFIETIIDTY